MKTTITFFTTLAMAGMLVGAARQTVQASSGIIYNCPNVETMEVAYAGSCPARSKTAKYENTGASSSTFYDAAPKDYNNVKNGNYELVCAYRVAGSNTDAITCQYNSGTNQPLKLAERQNAECPEIDQHPAGASHPSMGERSMSKRYDDLSPQPSGGSQPNVGERSLIKRYKQDPEFVCPWSSDMQEKYSFYSEFNSGTQGYADGAYTYECQVRDGMCKYEPDGVLATSDYPDCPTELCKVPQNARRSLKRGLDIENDPIRSS